jgi:hypothetical protein
MPAFIRDPERGAPGTRPQHARIDSREGRGSAACIQPVEQG